MSDESSVYDPARAENPWRSIGWAQVVKNNTNGSPTIEVWFSPRQAFEEGILTGSSKESHNTVDLHGSPIASESTRKSAVEAIWWPTEDGRLTPPNVCEGETVELFQFGTKRPYYWKSKGGEAELRRLEHVVRAYSNLSGGRKGFDLTSSYGITFSTREKFINIWTSMSNGEKFSYQFFIDTKDSRMGFHDNVGNMFGINSGSNSGFMRSAGGSYITVNGANVELKGATITADGKLHVTEIVTDSIKANRVEGSIINRAVGDKPSLPELPFEPFLGRGDVDTSGPAPSTPAAARAAKVTLDQLSMDALELRVRRLETLHDLPHEI